MIVTSHPPENRPLRWIAGYTLGKGILFLILAFSVLGFLHKDIDAIVANWIDAAGGSLENDNVAALLARLDVVTDGQLKALSAVTFVLGTVFVTEGVGLFFKKRWAEYLTVVVTASFIPLEIFESFRHFGPLKLVLLAINSLMVWYLVRTLRREQAPHDLRIMIAAPAE